MFLRLSALTSHHNVDHAADSTAEICPHCKSVFPGRPIMLRRLAQDHPVHSLRFPLNCPLCVQLGRPLPEFCATPLTFKRRRTAFHMRDFPIAVFGAQ